MASEWETVDSDEAFAALFVGRTVVFAGDVGRGDIGWRFNDGTELAMEVSTSRGCDTCGYGAGEKTYWVRRGPAGGTDGRA
jgi:hypothetical protein